MKAIYAQPLFPLELIILVIVNPLLSFVMILMHVPQTFAMKILENVWLPSLTVMMVLPVLLILATLF